MTQVTHKGDFTISDYNKYKMKKDIIVNVDGDVKLSSSGIRTLEVKFGVIKGFFNIYNNHMTTLENLPTICEGFIDVSGNKKMFSEEEINKKCKVINEITFEMLIELQKSIELKMNSKKQI